MHLDVTILMIFILVWQSATWRYDFKPTHNASLQALVVAVAI